jgi:hypothetical protein
MLIGLPRGGNFFFETKDQTKKQNTVREAYKRNEPNVLWSESAIVTLIKNPHLHVPSSSLKLVNTHPNKLASVVISKTINPIPKNHEKLIFPKKQKKKKNQYIQQVVGCCWKSVLIDVVERS